MKKLTLLTILFFAISSVWAQLPDNWLGDSDIETFQESTTVHGGDYSCGVIVNSGTQANCNLENEIVIPVTAGNSFTFTFWGSTSEFIRGRAVYLWEGANTTYSNEYLGPNTGGWIEFISEGVVPDGATGVRLGIRFYDVTGFVAGEVQYIDDVNFESPTGTTLLVANGDFESWPVISPEPTNYPTDFTGTAEGLNAILSWTDATGDQLPQAYLIKASTQDNITNPTDGVYEADDFDFSDENGAANISFGNENFTFSGLNPMLTYYFKIYSYNNTGVNIDFKNDGTPPAAMVEILNIVVIEAQSFDDSFGEWTPISVIGDQVWDRDNTYGVNGTPCAQVTGYFEGTVYENDDWLISPSLNLTNYTNELFSFYSAVGYITADQQFAVRISTDYDGGGDPTTANWTDLDPILPDGGTNWDWTNSGELDISGFDGDNVHVAFIYFCDTGDAATWEVDEILITGEGEPVVDPEPTNYPADFTVTAVNQSVSMTWLDATGDIIPEGYVVLIQDNTEFSLPEDGTPVVDDTDASDGYGAVNVMPDVGQCTFSGLLENTTYYAVIVPYTNSGTLIDYKIDVTLPPPGGQATTGESTATDILFTDFNEDWGGWTQYSVVGEQVWGRDNTYGIEGTPCAKMTGYEGEPFENEDWLISPAIDLTTTSNEMLDFYSALGYTGNALELLVSSDYDGTGNPNDFTWDNLTNQAIWPTGDPYFEWTASGSIALSNYTDQIIYIAFKFTSTSEGSATWEVDNIRVQGQIGIAENHPQVNLSLYPNPGNGIIYFDADKPVTNLEIFTVSGMLVYSETNLGVAGQLDLTHLNKGVYFVKMEADNKYTLSRRIVIQ